MTFKKHLDDMRWLFAERGLQHVHAWLYQLAIATVAGNVTGANGIGAIDMDAATSPGLSAALTNTIKPSGQLNLVTSTNIEYGAGAVTKTPPGNFRG